LATNLISTYVEGAIEEQDPHSHSPLLAMPTTHNIIAFKYKDDNGKGKERNNYRFMEKGWLH